MPEVRKDGPEVHELLWDTDEEGRLIPREAEARPTIRRASPCPALIFSAIIDKLRGHAPASSGQAPSGAPQPQSRIDVHAGEDGSAEQNIALQKGVMRKLAENGGKVPDSLRS